jgi:hypothetical protein
MKLVITENQYRTLVNEHYDQDKLYLRSNIVSQLQNGPKYMKQYIQSLPSLECTDSEGNKHICTKIPQVVYQFLFGKF